MIRIAFISNYFSHHQSGFSDALYHRRDTVYHFIETMPMEAERKNMGWGLDSRPPYIIQAYESEAARDESLRILLDADLVIVGDAPDAYVKERHRAGKFTFRYSERFYKNGCPAWQIPLRFVKNYYRFGRFKNEYMLCASAFTAADAALTRSYVGKTYKWGYFPETKQYDLTRLFAEKRKNPVTSILWAGRFLDWKHPDKAVETARYLKAQGLPFVLRIIGTGDMEETLRRMILENGLSDCVEMPGSMKPGEVREHMEQADIFLFTSDYREGWGAVLNEAMNSACAVAASHAIGSVPFLIRDRENGFIYDDSDISQLFEIVEMLVRDRDLRERAGSSAYNSIVSEWNAEAAAERLVALYENLNSHGTGRLFSEGPCSPAPVLQNEWYHYDRNS